MESSVVAVGLDGAPAFPETAQWERLVVDAGQTLWLGALADGTSVLGMPDPGARPVRTDPTAEQPRSTAAVWVLPIATEARVAYCIGRHDALPLPGGWSITHFERGGLQDREGREIASARHAVVRAFRVATGDSAPVDLVLPRHRRVGSRPAAWATESIALPAEALRPLGTLALRFGWLGTAL